MPFRFSRDNILLSLFSNKCHIFIGIVLFVLFVSLLIVFDKPKPIYHEVDDGLLLLPTNQISLGNVNLTVAKKLHKKVKVLCWIMTNSVNYASRGRHIRPTWGKRCNKLLFMGSRNHENADSIELPVNEGRSNLWMKTRLAFQYVYDHHLNDADWFLKADDDTYVILENLRYFLNHFDPNTPIYFGSKFKRFVKQGFMSGGAGYVLSKEALRRLIEEALPNPKLCGPNNTTYEDVKIGLCLQNVNVTAGDTLDSEGFSRFFPMNPNYHLTSLAKDDWYWRYMYHQREEDCCSKYTISFHYVLPEQMYLLDYLFYKVHAYGVID